MIVNNIVRRPLSTTAHRVTIDPLIYSYHKYPTLTKALIKFDKDNVMRLSNKYNLNISSWYCRDPEETEEKWLNDMVSIAKDRNQIIGIVLCKNEQIAYKIPLPVPAEIKLDVILHITQKNKLKVEEEVITQFDKLYETLEELVKS
jgi:hypothetical protein